MKITDIRTTLVAVPLSRVVRGGTYEIRARCTIITEVFTDAETDGGLSQGLRHLAICRDAINRAPTGKSPLLDALMDRCRDALLLLNAELDAHSNSASSAPASGRYHDKPCDKGDSYQ